LGEGEFKLLVQRGSWDVGQTCRQTDGSEICLQVSELKTGV
jgi:hypothetical protein